MTTPLECAAEWLHVTSRLSLMLECPPSSNALCFLTRARSLSQAELLVSQSLACLLLPFHIDIDRAQAASLLALEIHQECPTPPSLHHSVVTMWTVVDVCSMPPALRAVSLRVLLPRAPACAVRTYVYSCSRRSGRSCARLTDAIIEDDTLFDKSDVTTRDMLLLLLLQDQVLHARDSLSIDVYLNRPG